MHRGTEPDGDERRDGDGYRLEFACKLGAMCGVVDAPDGGSDSDDAREEDAGTECGGDERVEPDGCARSHGHDGDGDEDTELEGSDEWDFPSAMSEDRPCEGCDVGERWRGDECACEVVECGVVDDPFVELTDDKSDDAAFGCGDRPWEEEGGAELAGVVRSREPGHRVWVEGEERDGDELDGRSDRAAEP